MSISSKDIVSLDANDPLRHFRDEFHIRENLVYLDGNSLGMLPKRVLPRMKEALTEEWGEGLITSWLNADWVNSPSRVGDKIAKLIGADAGEVIVGESTSINLFKALTAALSLQPNRTVILTETTNFPTDNYIMQGLSMFLDGKIEYKEVSPDSVCEALDESVAVLLLTQVHYKTAKIRNLKEVTEKAHAAGALVVWDLSHSTGAIEVDLNDAGADFAVGCGYKFLNGGPGAPAYLFASKRHHSAQPVLSGWFGHAKPFDFTGNYEAAPNINRFQCGTPPVLGISALECGVDLMLEANIAEVRAKSIALSELFVNLVEELCGDFGFEFICPRDERERGSQVAFAHPHAYEIMQALKARDVIGDFRAPNIMRFGLTPLYLSYSDIAEAVQRLRTICIEREWNRPEYRTRAAVT
ncbi:kynureninase [Kordiimonas sp. SCSIO 12610]|uniref:kynureninase n=1 Tax=Kordiimonas sp. SCSIO 12610 TaxID=2829597 RepID=UPI0021096AF2|nr:kynureninase [Kordiimonas sp. SCSIO 12610]UTW54708.1 kynureninase [Kordiimonas sp. SCSIO 12610]